MLHVYYADVGKAKIVQLWITFCLTYSVSCRTSYFRNLPKTLQINKQYYYLNYLFIYNIDPV